MGHPLSIFIYKLHSWNYRYLGHTDQVYTGIIPVYTEIPVYTDGIYRYLPKYRYISTVFWYIPVYTDYTGIYRFLYTDGIYRYFGIYRFMSVYTGIYRNTGIYRRYIPSVYTEIPTVYTDYASKYRFSYTGIYRYFYIGFGGGNYIHSVRFFGCIAELLAHCMFNNVDSNDLVRVYSLLL